MEHQEPTNPEHEKVWELLKSAKTVEPSPFFPRNAGREVRRLEEEANSGWFAPLKEFFTASTTRPIMIGAATFALVAVAAVWFSNPDSSETTAPVIAAAEASSEEFDPAVEMAEVEYFGQLMAVADPAMLDDASIANLFF
ncbi:hypothetical protein N9Z18_01940 [Verrucomicrobiales bacterium]|jgi:hypothetical protein|nr:hypothetical protein [Verrucomicrobiales bacterium]MDB4358983.1 hypothetical protein [Verrucomicrobiales bacterium]|tara:strand:+ start:187 stop:606 length:420 start_codon:yes stop_codon:yes gene_type:complete